MLSFKILYFLTSFYSKLCMKTERTHIMTLGAPRIVSFSLRKQNQLPRQRVVVRLICAIASFCQIRTRKMTPYKCLYIACRYCCRSLCVLSCLTEHRKKNKLYFFRKKFPVCRQKEKETVL
jgi:hypothetical protein